MRLKMKNELIPLNLLVIVLMVTIIFFPSTVVRIILGLPFLLFFPGYTLLAALYPKRKGMSGIERVALSCGLSIAIVPLMGLILNSTPLGIRLEVILSSVASFILITSIIAWLRRKRLPEPERFSLRFPSEAPGWRGGAWDRVLSVVLVIAILGALGALYYIIAAPKVELEILDYTIVAPEREESLTKFYILGLSGEATDYPDQLVVGEGGSVIVGISNQEGETVGYRLEVRINGVRNNEVGAVVLEDEQEWQEEVSFVPQVAGENQKVEFLFYKQGQDETYQTLHFYVDVIELR